MKFFVDTADVAAIAELHDLGMVDGVTTNPSLILKSGRDILEVTKEICDLVPGPVSAEVVALDADDMIAEGRKLAKIADNITVKVPLTWAGLKACKTLSDEGRMVNVTLWPKVWGRWRGVVRRHALLYVEGDLQVESNVVNLVARRISPLVEVCRERGGPEQPEGVRQLGHAGMRRLG